jgi:hypothetical protein
MTEAVGSGNPVGMEDCGIRTEPAIGGPSLAIRRFEVGTVAKNPAAPFEGLTWTTLVTGPIDWIVACCGTLNAIRGFGAVEVVLVVDVDVEEDVDVDVVEDVDVVGVTVEAAGALVPVTPETCCEPRSDVNAGEPNRV